VKYLLTVLFSAHVNDECHCQYFNMVGHVMQTTANGAVYCYDRNSKRHSVVVQVSQRKQSAIVDLFFF